jgi:hypothetical protein
MRLGEDVSQQAAHDAGDLIEVAVFSPNAEAQFAAVVSHCLHWR